MTAVSPTVRRRQLAAELKAIREGSGLMMETLAERLGWHASKLSRIFNAQSGIRAADLKALLDALEVTDDEVRERLTTLAKQARERGWWQQYSDLLPGDYSTFIGLESTATSIRTFEAQLVPGLLQTEAYAHHVIRATRPSYRMSEVNRSVKVRLQRQALLTGEHPLKLWAVLDEAVLRRRIGGPEVMREQLQRLISMSAEPSVTLQVLPLTAGAHAAMEGPFVILSFPAPAHPDVVYLEGRNSGLYLEKEPQVEDYTVMFDHLRAVALGPDETVTFLEAAVDQIGNDH